MAAIQTNIHLAQAGLSAYSLFHAYTSITNLNKWEDKTEQAAKYSETAAQELHKTRTTQTSGALAIIGSLLCALIAVLRPPESDILRLALGALNTAICILARTHISNFWEHKAKIPVVQSYNDAISSTLIIKNQLGLLAIAWFVSTLFEARNVLK